MSTLLYATRTAQRKVAPAGTSEDTAAPKSPVYLDALVAIVPAEVLIVHAAAINAWTKTTKPDPASDQGAITTITDDGALTAAFFVLIALAFFFYWVRKKDTWDTLDLVRMLIPPAAFVVWTMAMQNTAFDAVVTDMAEGTRAVVAAGAAVALAALAERLGDIVHKANGG